MTLTQIKPAGLSKPVDLADNEKIRLGTGNDLEIYHNGFTSIIGSASHTLGFYSGVNHQFLNADGTETLAKFITNGAVELYYDNEKVFYTRGDGVQVQNVNGDGVLYVVGSEGNEAIIKLHADDGDDNADKFQIVSHADNYFAIQNFASGSFENNLKAFGNGAVELFYDNSKKFETTSTGVNITGNLIATGNLNVNDNGNINVGNSGDLQLFHNGTNSFIDSDTGNLVISSVADLRFNAATYIFNNAADNENLARFTQNGAVELYYDNVKKFETTSAGVKVSSGHLKLTDNSHLQLGDATNGDAVLLHNGTDTILDNQTGNLFLRSGSTHLQSLVGENKIVAEADGAVELYYNNSKKLETTNNGVDVTGDFKAISGGTEVQINPADGLINFGMDGRSSFVTNTNACYIYSGSGSGGSMPAGDLILQSRSNVNRTIRFVTGSTPAQRMSIDSGGLKFGTDTADANALDDYEEGTFSIGVTDSNNTFNTGQESGRYIKIGRVVHCTFTINCAISGTSGFAFFLTGFPFTVKNYGSHANEGLGLCKGTGQEIQLEAQQDNTTVKARNPSSGAAMSVNDVGCTNNTVKSIRGYIIYQTT